MRWSLSLLGCALGCSGPVPEELSQPHAQAIIDGQASGGEQDGVVMLRALLEDETELLCSASLVAPNLVLTARHCVSYLMPGLFSCNVRGELIDNPEGGGTLGSHLPAESIEVFGRATPRSTPLARGQQIISTLAQAICINDLAFIVLDTELELPIIPLRVEGPAVVGESGSLVGFGLVRGQRVIDYRYQARASKPDLEIAELGPDSLDEGVTTAPPRSLILRGPSGCVGDSGGPFLAASTGAVLGVYSLQAGGNCETDNAYNQLVHVPPFQALVAEAFAAAGAVPTPEPGSTVGEGASGGEAHTPLAGADSGGAAASEPKPRGGESSCSVAGTGRSTHPAYVWPALALLFGRLRKRRNSFGAALALST
jgi:hypothetical protein